MDQSQYNQYILRFPINTPDGFDLPALEITASHQHVLSITFQAIHHHLQVGGTRSALRFEDLHAKRRRKLKAVDYGTPKQTPNWRVRSVATFFRPSQSKALIAELTAMLWTSF